MITLADLRREFRPMMRLAAPLALAELSWMFMGIVDTLMAGPLGPAAVGAGSVGGMIFFPIAIAAPDCCSAWTHWSPRRSAPTIGRILAALS